MAKIRNPTLFSTQFRVSKASMDQLGVFDPMLNVDTALFVDPVLLRKSAHALIRDDATADIRRHFGRIISLLRVSRTKGDAPWRAAEKLVAFREVSGTCLGYGTSSISGRSLSLPAQTRILTTAKEIVSLGVEDPELFLLLPLFEDGIGADTISDLTTSVIEASLLRFTRQTAIALGLRLTRSLYKGQTRQIVRNPFTRRLSPVILVPRDILRHLPTVSSWDEVSAAASFNSALRGRVNKMVAQIWKAKTQEERRRAKKNALRNRALIEDLIAVVRRGHAKAYDFARDDRGLLAWHHIIQRIHSDYPLTIAVTPSEVGLVQCVDSIVQQFRFLVEEKGLNRLLWNKTKPNREKVSQLLFFAVAYGYCRANDIDISPEMDTGTGIIDFKFSHGYARKCIVEVKLSNNPNVVHGFEKQLEIYKRSEQTKCGRYVLIDVGGMGKKLDALYEGQNAAAADRSGIAYIDGRIRPSASKRR